MTDEQERVLVNAVERLTVIVQHIDWQALPKTQTDRAGEINAALADAFPWIRTEQPTFAK